MLDDALNTRVCLCGVLLLLVLSVGCGRGQTKLGLTWEEYNAEFFREAKTLELAPGYRWPLEAPGEKLTEGIANTYEKGCGRSDAEMYWFATWEKTWIDTRVSNPVIAREAFVQLERIKETYFYRVCNDRAGKELFDRMIRRAKLGDPSLIEQDLTANAPELLLDEN